MTRCATDFETLSAFADGELNAREELELRRHLEGCESCRAAVDLLLATKRAVASTAEVQPVPHSLRERVSDLAAGRGRKPSAVRLAAPALAAAALIAVVGAIYYLAMPAGRSSGWARLARAMVEDHVHYLALPDAIEVASSDPRRIAQAFAGQLGFHLELPDLPGASLLGARLCRLRGRKAVLTFYKTPSGQFSLFVLDHRAVPDHRRRHPECRAAGGYQVCLVSRAPEVLAMVADQRQAELLMPELQKLAAGSRP